MPKLFSKFGKLQRTADMNHEERGLGLTIVKEIVEKSGGLITVESEGESKGTLFIFSMNMNLADPTYDFDHTTSNGTGIEDKLSVGIGLKFDNTLMNTRYKVPDAADLITMDPNRCLVRDVSNENRA